MNSTYSTEIDNIMKLMRAMEARIARIEQRLLPIPVPTLRKHRWTGRFVVLLPQKRDVISRKEAEEKYWNHRDDYDLFIRGEKRLVLIKREKVKVEHLSYRLLIHVLTLEGEPIGSVDLYHDAWLSTQRYDPAADDKSIEKRVRSAVGRVNKILSPICEQAITKIHGGFAFTANISYCLMAPYLGTDEG